MHDGQFRHSGEPYFTHPVAVAAILTEMRLDDATIVTALLHDTIEDTRSTWADLARIFGRDIADHNRNIALVQSSLERNTSAKAAVEIALYDLFGQLYGAPAYLLLGERTAPAAFAGGLLILAGVYLVGRREPARRENLKGVTGHA